VARRALAKYVLGLSATVTRKDGHHPIIFMQCGPVRYRVSAKVQAEARPFSHSVIVRPTAFQSRREPETDKRVEFQMLYKELIEDERRNQLICEDLLLAVRDGRSPLLLAERHEHLDRFVRALSDQVDHVLVFRGQTGRRERADTAVRLATIPDTQARVLLATGKYIGEGFDDARLDTLFVTLPISWRGTVAQYVGRLHRLHDGKRDVRVPETVERSPSVVVASPCDSASRRLAIPKSRMRRRPSESIITFPLVRSRWTMPRSCACARPPAIPSP
jgi:superfamily II DNA or RNA helicase